MPSRVWESVVKIVSDVTGMASMDKATAGLTKMGTAAAATDKELEALGKPIDVAVNGEALNRLKARVGELRAQMAESLTIDVTADTAPAQAEIRRLQAQTRALADKPVPIRVAPVHGAEEAAGHVGELKNELLGLIGITPKLAKFVPAVAAAGVAIESIKASNELVTVENQLTTLTGSVEHMHEVMEGVDKLSVHLPIKQAELEQAAVTLAKFNVEADKIPGMLEDFGNVSIATGKPLGDLVNKFGQLNSAGVTQSRTLTALSKMGVPVYQALAQSMGVTVQDATALAKAGKLTTEQIDAMVTTLGKMDAGAAAATSKTLTGQLTLMGNAIEKTAQSLGLVLQPVIASFVGDLRGLVNLVLKVPTPILAWAAGAGILLAAMKLLSPALKSVYTGIVGIGKAVIGLPAKFTAMAAATEEVAAASTAAEAEMSGGLLATLTDPFALAVGGALVGLTLLTSGIFGTKKATEEWTKSLEYANGALADNNEQAIASHLQQDQLATDASKLGISLKTLIEAYAGQGDAVTEVQTKIAAAQAGARTAADEQGKGLTLNNKAMAEAASNAVELGRAADNLGKDFKGSTQAMKDQAAVQQAAAQANTDLGVSADVAKQATDDQTKAIQAQKQALAEDTTKVQGLIDSLSILNGAQLDVNDAARAYRAAQRGVTQAEADYKATLKDKHKTAADVAAASDAVAAALDAQARAGQQVIQAQIKNGASAKTVEKAYEDQRAALIKAAIATGMTKDAAKKYVDTVLKTPKEITTEIHAVEKGFDQVEEDKKKLGEDVTINVGIKVDPKQLDKLSAAGIAPGRGGGSSGGASAGLRSVPIVPFPSLPQITPYGWPWPAPRALPTQSTLAGAPQVNVFVQDRKLAGFIDVQVKQAAGTARQEATRRRVVQV